MVGEATRSAASGLWWYHVMISLSVGGASCVKDATYSATYSSNESWLLRHYHVNPLVEPHTHYFTKDLAAQDQKPWLSRLLLHLAILRMVDGPHNALVSG